MLTKIIVLRSWLWKCTVSFFAVGIFNTVLAQQVLPMPYFTNVTRSVGLSEASQQDACVAPSGEVIGRNISVVDVNGDYYPDLLLHLPLNEAAGDVLDKQCLYLNIPGDDPNDPHSRKFIDYTSESGIRSNRHGTNDGRHSSFSVFADVDNDGDMDMFSGLYAHELPNYTDIGDRNDLYINDGSGHFSLSSNSSFHLEPIHNTSSAVFLDYDKDGNIDLFIGNWYERRRPTLEMSEDILYRGDGNGAFTNVNNSTGLSGVSTAVYSVTATDWNDDGNIDLLAPSYSRLHPDAKSRLWENQGDGTFLQMQDTAQYAPFEGFGSQLAAFGSMPRDFDNDGDMDLLELLVHGAENGNKTTILVKENDVYSWDFSKLARVGGTAQHDMRDHYGNWIDYDNDGLADIVLSRCCNRGGQGNWLTLFKQQPDHTFDVVTSEAGLSVINDANLRVHNVTPLDFDRDGDEDLIIGFSSGTDGVQLWRNEVGVLNNWITIDLEGGGHSNQSAIGTRVEVITQKGTINETTYTREVHAGHGQFGPQTPLSLTMGLGQATQVDTIKIHWPNAAYSSSKFGDIDVNQAIHIGETAITDLVGDKDNFEFGDSVDVPPRSQRVVEILSFIENIGPIVGQNPGVDLDEDGFDRPAGLTHFFDLPDRALITSATIRFRVRGESSLVRNDVILYDESASPSELDPDCVVQNPDPNKCKPEPFFPVIALRDLSGSSKKAGVEPQSGETHELEINLSKVPLRTIDRGLGPGDHWPPLPDEQASLLSLLLDGQFDIIFTDDVIVDFSELRVSFVFQSAPTGDLTGDDIVDQDDLDIIISALNTDAYSSNDPRDLDGDGKITVLDARREVVLCWQNNRPRCSK